MLVRRLAFAFAFAAACVLACVPAVLTVRSSDGGEATDGTVPNDAACTGCADTSACGDVSSDPENCGRCGHDCLGGACMGGACQPFAIATNVDLPEEILLVGGEIYYGAISQTMGSVGVVPATGGGAKTLAAAYPLRLAVGGGNVVWTNTSVGDVAVGGGTPNPIFSPPGATFSDIVATSTHAIAGFRGQEGGTIEAIPFDGGTAETLVKLGVPEGIAMDAAHLYFVDRAAGTINQSGLDGSSVTTLVHGQPNAVFLTVDDANIYWLGETNQTDGFIAQAPLSGGNAVMLATGLAEPYGLASDGTNLYFTGPPAGGDGGPGTATINRVPIGGGAITPIASTKYNIAAGIAVDATAIYWADYSGLSIMKLAK
jgi:hypothetical protein